MTIIVDIVTMVTINYQTEYADLSAKPDANIRLTIAMTTFAAISAVMPLALGIGQGTAMEEPLAIVIISGVCITCR